MDVVTLKLGAWQTNAYLVTDGTSPDALLIDPVEDGAALVAGAERHGWRVVAIVSTHSHVDHVGGVGEARNVTGAPFLLGAKAVASLRRARACAGREPDRYAGATRSRSPAA